jgi:hypothetical protein
MLDLTDGQEWLEGMIVQAFIPIQWKKQEDKI